MDIQRDSPQYAPEAKHPEVSHRMKKKLKVRLPNKIIPIDNPDKAFHEKWYERRNPLNIPHPFRCVALGPPNVGKTTIVKNVILRAKPKFEEIFVIHCDPNYTLEYDDVGAQMLEEIPPPDWWEGQRKSLVVLDDLEYKGMSKQERRALDRLYGFVSTHKNISVILCSQDAFNVPPIVRRCSNLFILWKSHDIDSMATVARKSGLTAFQLKNMFNTMAPGQKDSIWIDSTEGSPYKLRINGYDIVGRQ